MDAFFIFTARYLFVLPIIVLGIYFIMRPRSEWKRMTLFAIPAGLLAYALGVLGGHFYFNPRPFVVLHFTPLIPHAPDNGFPSDHTLFVSAFATVGMFWSKRLGITLWAIAILVGAARVYTGLHHPIDVLGGMAFALIGVSGWYAVLKYARHA
ncbi:MAG TPA: phosphatase PAP2 family protein [Candidatus Paceibacterota bacterium]|nr:phosphatase PAP2 family protein [Candidatus Paceibacterota bacterium]